MFYSIFLDLHQLIYFIRAFAINTYYIIGEYLHNKEYAYFSGVCSKVATRKS